VPGVTGREAALKTSPAPPVRVLSVDLAYKRYRDCGVAVLERRHGALVVQLLEVPLPDPPDPVALAHWLVAQCTEHGASGICIDGPLGWKAPGTAAEHSRLSEKAVRAPGKTGLPPDGVKPRGYLPFTVFSIALFERLTTHHGLALPGATLHPSAPFVTETFPTAAWRQLGLAPLPAKARTTPALLEEAVHRLRDATGVLLEPDVPTHDQLQAVVGGIAGLWWGEGARHRVQLAGAPPFRLDDSWREGYIMVPAAEHAPFP
jgi:hypothetical protein